MTWLSLKIRGHRRSEKLLCHEEYQKLVHSSKPIWTPYVSPWRSLLLECGSALLRLRPPLTVCPGVPRPRGDVGCAWFGPFDLWSVATAAGCHESGFQVHCWSELDLPPHNNGISPANSFDSRCRDAQRRRGAGVRGSVGDTAHPDSRSGDQQLVSPSGQVQQRGRGYRQYRVAKPLPVGARHRSGQRVPGPL